MAEWAVCRNQGGKWEKASELEKSPSAKHSFQSFWVCSGLLQGPPGGQRCRDLGCHVAVRQSPQRGSLDEPAQPISLKYVEAFLP